jgi:hypothetical protein
MAGDEPSQSLYVSAGRMRYIAIAFAALVLTACATKTALVMKPGRTYEPCTSVQACIKTIHDVIKNNWARPATQLPGQVSGVELHIELTDNAEIAIASVDKSSGSADLDESALAAVYRAADFRELKGLDAATFEQNFRRFKLHFKPDAAGTSR